MNELLTEDQMDQKPLDPTDQSVKEDWRAKEFPDISFKPGETVSVHFLVANGYKHFADDQDNSEVWRNFKEQKEVTWWPKSGEIKRFEKFHPL